MFKLKSVLTVIAYCGAPIFAFAMGAGSGANAVRVPIASVCEAGKNTFQPLQDLNEALKSPSPDSPFVLACQSSVSLNTEPKTGLMKWSVPQADTQGVTSREFFQKLLDRLMTMAVQNATLAQNIQTCMRANPPENNCAVLRKTLNEDLTFKIGEARYNLALAQGPKDFMSGFGKPKSGINESLSAAGLYKAKAWDQLSADEAKQANEALKSYRSEIRAEANKRKSQLPDSYARTKFESAAELIVRAEHFDSYLATMTKYPILQFIHSKKPTQEEFVAAGDEMKKQIKNEMIMLARMQRLLEKSPAAGPPPAAVLESLKYTSVVEGLLLENPKFCGVAAAAKRTAENRETAQVIGVSLPLMAACFAAPPLVAGAIGAGVATWSLADSQAEWTAAQSRALSQFEEEKGVSSPTELSDLYERRNFDASVGLAMNAAGPAFLGAARIRVMKSFTKSSPSETTGAKVLSDYSNKRIEDF